MPVRQDVDACFAGAGRPGGIGRAAFEALLPKAASVVDQLWRRQESEAHPFVKLAGAKDDLNKLQSQVEDWLTRFQRLVVLGTGGASLGGRALVAVGADKERVLFLDNADSDRLERVLGAPELEETGFLIASKSGATAETLAQALLVLDAAEPTRVTVITQPGDSPLRRLADRFGLQTLDHHPALGGRYAALSAVGLLPAMVAGIDPAAARKGAHEVLSAALEAPESSAPAVGAALAVAAMRAWPRAATVLMPYGPGLHPFGLWYRQLWAESLGKQGRGSVPILAPGPVDQHSQLQLFLDGPVGPGGMLFTVLEAPDPVPRRVDAALAEAVGAGYLGGRSMGALIATQAEVTARMLVEAGRPVRRLRVPAADERAIGGLMMHFMLETVIAAHLLGVDPFDQPAVERGKGMVRRHLEAGS